MHHENLGGRQEHGPVEQVEGGEGAGEDDDEDAVHEGELITVPVSSLLRPPRHVIRPGQSVLGEEQTSVAFCVIFNKNFVKSVYVNLLTW